MPGHNTHTSIVFSVIGIILYSILILLLKVSFINSIILFPIVVLMSVLPDIDHWASKVRKLVWKTLLVGIIILSFIDRYRLLIPFFALICLVVIYSMHRKWFHTWIAGLVLASPVLFLGYKEFFIAFIVYNIHIIIDKIYSKTKRKVKAIKRKIEK